MSGTFSVENEGGIYEVLRVVNGVPLFLEDHLKRFFHSANIRENYSVHGSEIKLFLENLIVKNKVIVGNILMSFKINLIAFFISHIPKPEFIKKELFVVF